MLYKIVSLLIVYTIMNFSFVKSQQIDKPKAENYIFVGLVPNLSHTGLNGSAIVGFQVNRIQFTVGLKYVISDSYFPGVGQIGPEFGIGYTFLKSKKVEFFGLLKYQASFYKPLSTFKDAKNKRNSVHEYTYSYGIKIKLINRLWMENSFGFGGVISKNHDLQENNVSYSYGTTGLIRIGLFYRLF
ncbi:MAG: hypothetical protein HRT73_15875 [Flavobacteriales bacterium]|nr:hypothetical protein [Flavobacteriales bacterium]NQX99335.1 hypothetical protein [Flavobacteriales bacterium]